MKINVVGGGPAGLYFAYLTKKTHPEISITVFERNSADATYGFGVVLAEGGLKTLRDADVSFCDDIVVNSEALSGQVIDHPDGLVTIDSESRAGSISRLRLLQLLHARCAAVGVELVFGVEIRAVKDVSNASLVIAADGANSSMRSGLADLFGATSFSLNNRFAWYGIERAVQTSTLAFRRVGQTGAFVGHYYRYSPTMSTFVAECDAATWAELKMETMTDDERRLLSQKIFEKELNGAPLVANNSVWRQFQVVRNESLAVGNVVLLGDAERSMHFSIGSGTRMAMEDAVALFRALEEDRSSTERLAARFGNLRRPRVQPFWQAAMRSIQWYEAFAEKMRLPPILFAYDYMMRTGRMSEERLRAEHPLFMKDYDNYCHSVARTGTTDEKC